MTAQPNRAAVYEVRPSSPMERPAHLPPPTEPRQSLERRLVDIWQAELGMAPIGIDDDFFELDGDSVQALNILLAFEESSRIKLAPSVLVNNPTIRKLASVAGLASPGDAHDDIVTLCNSGSTVPVYFVPGLQGDAMNALSLAKALGDDIPFYGVQNMDVATTAATDPSVEGMAANLVAVIRGANPDGPYIMAGYCVGAILAYEVAQQLRQSGADVPLLIMIDAVNKSDFGPVARWAARWRSFRRHDGAAARDKLRKFVRGCALSILFRAPVLGRRLHHRYAVKVNAELDRGPSWHLIDQAYGHYRPRPYGGRIVLYTSEEYRSRLATNNFGWARLAGAGLDIIDSPTEHLTMLKPDAVKHYCDDLRERIIAARPAE